MGELNEKRARLANISKARAMTAPAMPGCPP